MAKGAVKELSGKARGDAKLKSAGKVDRFWGRIQKVIGGLRSTLVGK